MKLRKQQKRLERRRKAYDLHGPYPTKDNPGKEGGLGTGHVMHRPGSNTK